MMYMGKAENEKSTVLQGFREKMSEAVSIFIIRKQESAFGSWQCEPFTDTEFCGGFAHVSKRTALHVPGVNGSREKV